MELINPITEQEFVTKWRSDFVGNEIDDKWIKLQIGANQFVTTEFSELKIRSGVTANAQTILRCKKPFTIPCRVFFIYYLTQRINNQFFIFELIDDSGSHYARFNLSGINSTIAIGQTANSFVPSNDATFITHNSLSYSCLELDVGIDEVKFVSSTLR